MSEKKWEEYTHRERQSFVTELAVYKLQLSMGSRTAALSKSNPLHDKLDSDMIKRFIGGSNEV